MRVPLVYKEPTGNAEHKHWFPLLFYLPVRPVAAEEHGVSEMWSPVHKLFTVFTSKIYKTLRQTMQSTILFDIYIYIRKQFEQNGGFHRLPQSFINIVGKSLSFLSKFCKQKADFSAAAFVRHVQPPASENIFREVVEIWFSPLIVLSLPLAAVVETF